MATIISASLAAPNKITRPITTISMVSAVITIRRAIRRTLARPVQVVASRRIMWQLACPKVRPTLTPAHRTLCRTHIHRTRPFRYRRTAPHPFRRTKVRRARRNERAADDTHIRAQRVASAQRTVAKMSTQPRDPIAFSFGIWTKRSSYSIRCSPARMRTNIQRNRFVCNIWAPRWRS